MRLSGLELLQGIANYNLSRAVDTLEFLYKSGEALEAGALAVELSQSLDENQKQQLSNGEIHNLVAFVKEAAKDPKMSDDISANLPIRIARTFDLFDRQKRVLLYGLFEGEHYDVAERFIEEELDDDFFANSKSAIIFCVEKFDLPTELEEQLRDKLGHHHEPSG